jgi:small subunit ribosomal protein S16
VARDEAKQLNLNEERTKYWLSVGAQPSDTMRDILAKRNLVNREKWEAERTRRRDVIAANKAAAPAAEEKKA